ncbi:MAG: glycosyltransferase [Pseudomonadota bacterium]
MHILVVNVFFAPNTYGGATIVAEEVAKRLAARPGIRVSAFSAIQRSDLPPYALVRTRVFGIDHFMINLRSERDYVDAYQNPSVSERLADLARDLKPDLAHFHCLQDIGADSLRALGRGGVPVVLSVHDFWWLCERQFMVRPNGAYCGQSPIDVGACRGCVDDHGRTVTRAEVLRSIGAAADLVTYPSRFAQELSERSGFAPGLGRVWENGVQLPSPDFFEAQTKRRTSDPRVVFGFVGGPSQIKGWPLLRAVFSGLGRHDFAGRLVDGSRDGSWWSDRTIAALDGDWTVVPRYDQATMDHFWSEIDVLLFLSQWKETFGLTIREALCRGIRVVQTYGGGTVEHEGGDLASFIPMGSGPEPVRREVMRAIDAGQVQGMAVPVTSFDDQAQAFLELVSDVLPKQRGLRTVA